MTDTTGQGLDPRVEQAIDDAKEAADRASREAAGTLDAMKTAAADAAQRGAAAVSDATSQARAIAEESLEDAEDLLEDAGEWVERKYRENPTLVLALAVAAGIAMLVGLGAIVRALTRR